jgi:hypothetical protein
MVRNLFRIITLVILFSFYSVAVEPSHYEAARKLIEITKKLKASSFIDTVVNQLIKLEPDLKSHKDEIYKLIQGYLTSDEFKETKINAVIYYFTEEEIIQITNKMQGTSFQRSTREQAELVKRYNKTFNILKQKFIEYIRGKMPALVKKKK